MCPTCAESPLATPLLTPVFFWILAGVSRTLSCTIASIKRAFFVAPLDTDFFATAVVCFTGLLSADGVVAAAVAGNRFVGFEVILS